MRYFNLIKQLLLLCLSIAFLASAAYAEEQLPHPDTYLIHAKDMKKKKGLFLDILDELYILEFNRINPSIDRYSGHAKSLFIWNGNSRVAFDSPSRTC